MDIIVFDSGFRLPEDKNILLKDIVHENESINTALSGNYWFEILSEYIVPFDKTLQILDKEVQRGKVGYFRKDSQANRVYYIHDKAITLTGEAGGGAAKMGQYLFGHTKENSQGNRVYTEEEKSACLNTSSGGTAGVGNILFGCITPDRVEKRQNGQRFNDGKKFYTLTAQDKHGVLIEGYIRKLTPTECERLQTFPDRVFYAIIDLKELLCLDQAKNFVNAVEKNHKLLKLVLSAEKKELKEYVNIAIQSMSVSHQSKKYIAQKSVDTQTPKQTKECTSHKQTELNTSANNVENSVLYQSQETEVDSVAVNVPMNLIEGRIAHNGKAESLLKDNNSLNQKNGRNVQKLYLKEIMELAENVGLGITKKIEKSSIYTTSYHLSTQNIEQILTILYYFAKNVIDGCIAKRIQIKSLYLSLTDGYTYGISKTQRYKALGNSFTVDVIAHILGGIND